MGEGDDVGSVWATLVYALRDWNNAAVLLLANMSCISHIFIHACAFLNR